MAWRGGVCRGAAMRQVGGTRTAIAPLCADPSLCVHWFAVHSPRAQTPILISGNADQRSGRAERTHVRECSTEHRPLTLGCLRLLAFFSAAATIVATDMSPRVARELII